MHTYVNNDYEDTSTWGKLLKREGGESENYGIQAKMEQTVAPTMAERKLQVDNVVPSYTEVKSMIAAQVARTKQMVAKEISNLLEDSLDDILQFRYGKAQTRVLFVV